MSYIHLLIKKQNKIRYAFLHYRKAKQVLDSLTIPINCPADAGYLIVDFDKKTIINNQNAFAVNKERFETINI